MLFLVLVVVHGSLLSPLPPETAVAAPSLQNLPPLPIISQNKPVVASSYSPAYAIPEKANDGDFESGDFSAWQADFIGSPEEWTVDLGVSQPMSSVVIHWGAIDESERVCYKYYVATSDDGVSFTTIVDNTGNTELDVTTDELNGSVQARFLKLIVIGGFRYCNPELGQISSLSVLEVQVFGVQQLPLIFIPGISGSYLDDVETTPPTNLWTGGPRTDYKPLSLYPNDNPVDDIVATDAIRSVLGFDVYGSFLERMIGEGYREYRVEDKPERRSANCGDGINQQSAHPTLFVFAYDWRQDNADSAKKLGSGPI